MHLVIPFAAPLSEPGKEALRSLRWPHLQALLAGRTGQRDEGDELGLSPPHERALARPGAGRAVTGNCRSRPGWPWPTPWTRATWPGAC
jgi:hypothetical protein